MEYEKNIEDLEEAVESEGEYDPDDDVEIILERKDGKKPTDPAELEQKKLYRKAKREWRKAKKQQLVQGATDVERGEQLPASWAQLRKRGKGGSGYQQGAELSMARQHNELPKPSAQTLSSWGEKAEKRAARLSIKPYEEN